MKIILFDIESTPLESYTWTKYINGPVIKVKKDWQLLSFALKELNKGSVQVYSRRNMTERQLVKKMRDVFMDADVLVAHNGDSFDIKKVKAKFIEFGLKPVPHKSSIDTKKLAKQSFAFTGNSLDELARLLKVGSKVKHSGFELWERCMAGEVAAFKEMEAYNKHDVVLLEGVYNKLQPWAKNHPNVSVMQGRPEACPKCGHGTLQARGKHFTGKRLVHRFMCKGCYGWTNGKAA